MHRPWDLDHDSGGQPDTALQFEAFLAYLKQARGFDLSDYKRSSLLRRVGVRMHRTGLKGGFADYVDVLEADPQEYARLFSTIFINLTRFFRDPAAWEYIRDVVVPRLVQRATGTGFIRVWSAGCASGEEAYSIAMLLAESLGAQAFHRQVKIYATDVDDDALSQARHATYTARATATVPAHLLERYFEPCEGRYTVRRELRRSVTFGRHDLIQDAPMPRVDLLVCRNCLMYLNAEAQARILSRFQFALEPGGVLFLGKAETLPRHSALEPEDVDHRIFVKPAMRPSGDFAGSLVAVAPAGGGR